jgi:hypothetical protein
VRRDALIFATINSINSDNCCCCSIQKGAVAKAGEPLTGKVVAAVRGKVPDGKLIIFLSGKESTYIHKHFVRERKKHHKTKTARYSF